MAPRRLLAACAPTLLTTLAWAPARAASPMSRLQGVSQHAREQASTGPSHLWVGLGIGLVLATVIAVAAFWALRGRRG